MVNDLISRKALIGEYGLFAQRKCPGNCQYCNLWTEEGCRVIIEAPAVDAVEVTRIEEVKQVLLRIFDNLIVIHRDISNSPLANSAKYLDIPESSNDYYGIYADVMEVAREYVNIALTDLCDKDVRRELG